MTFYDYARYRLSIFTREEAQAIAAYLIFKRVSDSERISETAIEAALNSFWNERAKEAASRAEVDQYFLEEEKYLNALFSADNDGG